MKIISWNVNRVLEKMKEARKLAGENLSYVLCIQETKLSIVDDFLCSSIWGKSGQGYSFQHSVGASGGLLIV